MLIEFQVENYLSFRDPVALSMLASNKISEHKDENIIPHKRTPLLKTAVIYGANASGKSNLLNSLVFMRGFVINSSKEGQTGEPINIKPFKLDVASLEQPSRFEVVFLLDEVRYRYGFEATREMVVKEWLFKAPKIAEKALFLRDGEDIDVSQEFTEGKRLEENTRSNALFLSVVANLNGKLSGQIIEWFRSINFVHGLHERGHTLFSTSMLKDVECQDRLMDFIRKADFGIKDILVTDKKIDVSKEYPHLTEIERQVLTSRYQIDKRTSLHSVHNRYKDDQIFDTVTMDFEEEESEGTRKFFALIGPVLDCLNKGSILVADEMESKMHPLLTRMIVRLFHSSKTNPKNAQLIFATHDTNLLQNINFRRDQIWFTEKTQQQATDLYSLAEIKLAKGAVRKDASYEKDYFRGRYGAVPYLGEFEELLMEEE